WVGVVVVGCVGVGCVVWVDFGGFGCVGCVGFGVVCVGGGVVVGGVGVGVLGVGVWLLGGVVLCWVLGLVGLVSAWWGVGGLLEVFVV
ncbi:hypothetical protein, partial [Pseudomonas syringae group genomosp. 7]|uniref:hypothetical protein n=1 Tax=Pseudomonas syringae group genomosp. 7 TaxID=251699 RepID=UPI00377011B6